MNYRRLGRTGLQVSEVGFGSHHFDRDGKRIGALTQNSFTERERIEHVATALDLGINYLHCVFTIGEVHNWDEEQKKRAEKEKEKDMEEDLPF